MAKDDILQKYYRRLEGEGWLKAALAGLAAGFVCDFLVAFITLLTHTNGLWLAVGIGAGVFLLSVPAFYFLCFKPTDRDVAKRLDALGLEERISTMLAFKGEPSGIYELQRKDAQAALAKVDEKSVKLIVSPILFILSAVAAVFGVGMTIANGLTARGESLVNVGEEEDPFVEQIYCTVTYETASTSDGVSFVQHIGGYVEGGNTQVVRYGEDAQTVVAVADEGFVFVCWQDTMTASTQSAYRTDRDIKEDVTYVAVFMMMDTSSSSDSNSPDNDDNNEPNHDYNDTSNSLDREYNSIITGDTYYRDVIEQYYEQAMQQLAEGTLSDEMRAFIEQYYGIIL